MKKKNFGFVGPFGTANFGDWAMLVNNMYDLKCEEATIFTYNERFPKISLDEYCDEINTQYVVVKLHENEMKKINNESKLFATPYDILSKIKNYDEVYDAISKLDSLIISGGGWVNGFWAEATEKLYKMIIPILIAKQQGKEIIFTANGIGPLDNSKELYRCFFNYINSSKIAIRDFLYSRSYLLDIGVDTENIHFLPDDLYLINDQILEKKEYKSIKIKDYIVIEMFYPLEKLEEYKERLIEFSKKIYTKYGLSILLLPYDLVHFGSEQAKYLNSIFEYSEIYSIDEMGFLPIQDAYNVIKNAKLMITSRYHGLVLSLSTKTPVIYRMVEKMGDVRYSYNKGMGMLSVAFDGIQFRETDFLSNDLIQILENVELNLKDIITVQNDIFTNSKYEENKKRLKEIRKFYFEEISNK